MGLLNVFLGISREVKFVCSFVGAKGLGNSYDFSGFEVPAEHNFKISVHVLLKVDFLCATIKS
jgi:hypothetical protein